jgi:hypothetical protein
MRPRPATVEIPDDISLAEPIGDIRERKKEGQAHSAALAHERKKEGTFSHSGSRMMLARPVAMVIFDDKQGTRSRRTYWHGVQQVTFQEISEMAIARSKLVDVSVTRESGHDN